MSNPRVVFAAGVVLVAVAAAALLLSRGGADPAATRVQPRRIVHAPLKLEQFDRPDTGKRELLVSLPGSQFNRADLTGGAPVVWLRCFDGAGALAIRQPIDWPLIEEEGFPPHIHQPADQRLLDRVRRCRLTGPGIDFEARLSGRVPAAAY